MASWPCCWPPAARRPNPRVASASTWTRSLPRPSPSAARRSSSRASGRNSPCTRATTSRWCRSTSIAPGPTRSTSTATSGRRSTSAGCAEEATAALRFELVADGRRIPLTPLAGEPGDLGLGERPLPAPARSAQVLVAPTSREVQEFVAGASELRAVAPHDGVAERFELVGPVVNRRPGVRRCRSSAKLRANVPGVPRK